MNITRSAWSVTVAAALLIVIVNLLVLGAGRLLGADMWVAQSEGAEPMQVGLVLVALTSIVPALAGGATLWLAERRSAAARQAVGWLGLAVGLLTVVMPYSVVATAGTSATLALMHVAAGLVWFSAVRSTAPERGASDLPPGSSRSPEGSRR